MKTFVFQLEVEIADGQDIVPALKQVMRSTVDHLSALKKAGEDPPFRLTVVEIGFKE